MDYIKPNDLRIPMVENGMIEPNTAPIGTLKFYKRSITARVNPTHQYDLLEEAPQKPLHHEIKLVDIFMFSAVVLLSSVQFPLYCAVCSEYDKIAKPSNETERMITAFYVLTWKWLMYLVAIIPIGLIGKKYFLPESAGNGSPVKHSAMSTLRDSKVQANLSYAYCWKCFFTSVNVSDLFSYITIDNLASSTISIISTFCLFYSARTLPFGICALIYGLSTLLPLYSVRNVSDTGYLIVKLLCPVMIVSGMIIANLSIERILNLFLCMFAVFGCQYINQITLKKKINVDSPYDILLSAYFNYVIVSVSICLIISIIRLKFDFVSIIGFAFDSRLALYSTISFAVIGALYSTLSVVTSLAFSAKNLIKGVKYFEVYLNDLLGVFLFKKPFIFSSFAYDIGILQCVMAMAFFDFYFPIKKFLEKKFKPNN